MRAILVVLFMAASCVAQSQPQPVPIPAAACSLELVHQLDLRCSEDEPCPLYLEIADAEIVGDRLVLAGNIHTPSATLQSILMISDDGGKTWTEPHARIPAGVLVSIQFLDFEIGWISGHILRPDAREPFFLITSDGGKTWRRRAVYSEPKAGTIEHFRFDSRTAGKMLIDRGRSGESGLRYELWESMTSGDSWSVRQVDARPIPFPGGADSAKPKAVRVRADAAAKLHRIERQQSAAQWQPVASFPINAGECKPIAPEPPAQAPEESETKPNPEVRR